jgi:hypothetical protein
MVTVVRMLGALGLLLPVAACTSPRCEPIQGCDVRKASCQREALRVAACLRGSPADTDVDVEIVSYDAFVEAAVREASQYEPTDQDLDVRRALVMFGLSPTRDAEADARRNLAWVGAFYDREVDRITILDRGGDHDRASQRGNTLLLVHEMVHALQGAEGLLTRAARSYEEAFTATALVEGEATLLEDRAHVESLGFPFDEVDYRRALEAFVARSRSAASRAEDAFAGIRSGLTYALGARQLYADYLEGGLAAVRERLEAGARANEALFGREPSPERIEQAIPIYDEATLVASYHFGGALVDTFLQRAPLGFAKNVTGHVVDDVFSVQRMPDGGVVAAWRIRFDPSISARDIVEWLDTETFERPVVVGQEGERELWFIQGSTWSSGVDPEGFMPAPEVDTGHGAELAHPLRCALRGRAAL